MPAWLFPAAMTAGSKLLDFGLGMFGARQQEKANRRMAQWQHDRNWDLLQYQLNYDLPKNQMQRLKDAGLNPHLMYGQGSPGNQGSPMRYPEVQPGDYQSAYRSAGEFLPLMSQTALAASQVQATDAKTQQTYAITALNKLQEKVLSKNPLLNDEGYKAMIQSLIASAQIKQGQAGITQNIADWQPVMSQNAAVKMQREIDILDQRFKLNSLDSQIKSEVLKSKEFQNAILEIQKKFIADGEIGSQQILQFIQLLLMKSL